VVMEEEFIRALRAWVDEEGRSELLNSEGTQGAELNGDAL